MKRNDVERTHVIFHIMIVVVLAVFTIVTGCKKAQDEKPASTTTQQEAVTVKHDPAPVTRQDENTVSTTAKPDVSIVNQAGDSFFTKMPKPDGTVTPERVKEYAQQKFSQCLKQVGLDSEVTVALDFSIGVEGKMLKDPIRDPNGSLLEIGGTAELPYPSVKADFRVIQAGKELFAATFRGGNFNGSKDWDGVKSVIDMSVGHLLKEFAKRDSHTTKILAILAKEQLIPQKPYVHLEVNFGKIRIHQDGNLWEALAEIGEPARQALEQATKDKDPEISDEAKQALQRIKKP